MRRTGVVGIDYTRGSSVSPVRPPRAPSLLRSRPTLGCAFARFPLFDTRGYPSPWYVCASSCARESPGPATVSFAVVNT